MPTVNPRDFDADYVQAAVHHWISHPNEAHLAIHAITQFDVLAEVTALWMLLKGRAQLGRNEATKFRDAQGARESDLALIRDIHDSHKHGRLSRTNAVQVSEGQRPKIGTFHGFFCGVTSCGGPPTPYSAICVALNDGRTVKVLDVLNSARQAWDREYIHFGIADIRPFSGTVLHTAAGSIKGQ